MKSTVTGQKRNMTPALTKAVLVMVFLFGAALVFMGWRGMQEYNSSGFSSEAAYRAIYQLHGDVESAWSMKLEPQTAVLSEQDRALLDQTAYELLTAAWENQKKGSTEKLNAILAEEDAESRRELLHKLLYTTYLVSGPKVSTANKKEITAIPESERDDFRLSLLQAVMDEGAALPTAAEKLAGKLSGQERQASLIQA